MWCATEGVLLRNAHIYTVCCSAYRYERDCKKDVYMYICRVGLVCAYTE